MSPPILDDLDLSVRLILNGCRGIKGKTFSTADVMKYLGIGRPWLDREMSLAELRDLLDAARAIADAKNLTEQIRLLGPLTTAVTDARRDVS